MIQPYVDEQVKLFQEGELDKLPHTHPEFGGVIYWHSLEEGFVSYEGYITTPLTPRDINLTATIRFNTRFLERYYTLENYGGNSTKEQNIHFSDEEVRFIILAIKAASSAEEQELIDKLLKSKSAKA